MHSLLTELSLFTGKRDVNFVVHYITVTCYNFENTQIFIVHCFQTQINYELSIIKLIQNYISEYIDTAIAKALRIDNLIGATEYYKIYHVYVRTHVTFGRISHI